MEPPIAGERQDQRAQQASRLHRIAANRTQGLEGAGDDEAGKRIGYGATSPATSGQAAAGGQVAWADPESGLSFVFLTSNVDANFVRSYRREAIVTRLAAQCSADLHRPLRISEVPWKGRDLGAGPSGRAARPVYVGQSGNAWPLCDSGFSPGAHTHTGRERFLQPAPLLGGERQREVLMAERLELTLQDVGG